MSTGSKKVPRKTKRVDEKDKRMAQLEKEIARLEYENSKLKSDSADYENRLAAVSGPARFAREFPTVNRILQSAVDKTVSLKAEKPLQNSAKAERGEESAGSAKGKKKSNAKGTRNSKKAKK